MTHSRGAGDRGVFPRARRAAPLSDAALDKNNRKADAEEDGARIIAPDDPPPRKPLPRGRCRGGRVGSRGRRIGIVRRRRHR
mmetsp:Transcript_890/g.2550  ORF Transcript_890/g.2550 Transcript_890/m.2550 type:complete len:82 (-) Transcript_890:108-353(-)